jgi:hypothetical protein
MLAKIVEVSRISEWMTSLKSELWYLRAMNATTRT